MVGWIIRETQDDFGSEGGAWKSRTSHTALEYSGSYAKETGVRGISDGDVFISIKSATPGTLKEIYNNLFRLAGQQGWAPRMSTESGEVHSWTRPIAVEHRFEEARRID
jgi:hypothetical protein